MKKNLKKVVRLQYITLILLSILLIIFPLICVLIGNMLEPGANADGPQIIGLMLIAGFSIYTVVPIGAIVLILSTIAFILYNKSKWKIARVLNLICIGIIIIVVLGISICRIFPIIIVLWSIIGFYIHIMGKTEDLLEMQEQQEIIEQNSEKD